jgi:hypothetical protein
MMRTFTKLALAILCVAPLGCASTNVETSGFRMGAPLCTPAHERLSAFVYWLPKWRSDQKEPARREAFAARGIQEFFGSARCVTQLEIRRLPDEASGEIPSDEELLGLAASAMPAADRVFLIVVRELGPKMFIGIPVIVRGSTEVVVEIRVLDARHSRSMANMKTHWENGGRFIIKGVKTLDTDMSAALSAALMPDASSQ